MAGAMAGKTALPQDYVERVYAGVLGKIIGVYLGRPFEGWTHQRIMQELGEVSYYVNDRLKAPLIVTDDDITGTLTFIRALADYGNTKDLTAEQIGQSWLNYIIENRTILWWGGMGNSTEHTAFLRLKNGIPAPRSGSIELNGPVVAEQIGAQIFIDGWAMVSPGQPEQAAEFARRAGSVSHDGEAVYGAQVIAAMEAQAFVESDLQKLLDVGQSCIPKDSTIYKMNEQIRELHEKEKDWYKARRWLEDNYGYQKYGGNVHIVPNHGVIILALLYGEDNFQKSLMIANTCGWDTDCNSGNVGCLMGIKNGLAGISGADWRGPVADRILAPTADGGTAITDAVTQTYRLVNMGRALAGEPPLSPKGGARFHFELPGSVQGFQAEASGATGKVSIENAEGHSAQGKRSLAIHYQGLSKGQPARVATPTFIPPDYIHENLHYELLASPLIYSGQRIKARVEADRQNSRPVSARLFLRCYGEGDQLSAVDSPPVDLAPGAGQEIDWTVPDTGGRPIAEVGVELAGDGQGTVYLDSLTWSGEPDVTLKKAYDHGVAWRKAWVNAIDEYGQRWPEAFRLIQNCGTGLLIQGTDQWKNYTVSSAITPHLAASFGVAARVQGLERYYALLLDRDQKARLVKRLDGQKTLAEKDFKWSFYQPYNFRLEVNGARIRGWVNEQLLFEYEDRDRPLLYGGIALVIEEGRAATEEVRVQPGSPPGGPQSG